MLKKEKVFDIYIILLWIVFSTELLFRSYHSISLYVITPFLFVFSIYKTPYLFKDNYIIAYLVIMFWSLITCFTSINQAESWIAYRVMAGCFMISFIMYSFITRSNSPQRTTAIFFTFILLFLTTFIYLYLSGDMYALDTTTDRLEGKNMNGNDIAYELFHVVIVVFIFINAIRDVNSMFKMIISVFLVFLSLWCSILTGSRQIVVVIIPLVVVSAFFSLNINKSSKSKRFIRLLLVFIGIGIVIGVFQRYFYNTLMNSFLYTRMQDNMAEDSRVGMISRAFVAGVEHPFFGVGTGCFYLYDRSRHFSHCTYTELFANSGIIPLIAYLYMVIKFMVEQRKRYRITKDRVFLYLFICSIFWAAYNFFYAFNTTAWSMSFFFLLIGYSNNAYRTKIVNQ